MTDAIGPIRSLPTEPFVYDYPGAHDAVAYELENRMADPDARIEAFIESIAPLDGRIVVDVGAGGGYHAVRFAVRAAHVFAVEPAAKMLVQLHRRVAGEEESVGTRISVLSAGAEAIPLPDASVDIVHSRFAYFFGPERPGVRSCEPGIEEALRILRPGGQVFIVDHDLRHGDYAGFLRDFGPAADQPALAEQIDDFWAGHGFAATTIESAWRAPSRGALGRVIRMEFGEQAQAVMERVEGAGFRCAYRVYHRQR